MEKTIRIEQSNGNNAVQVILDYDKGGWNYFNGKIDPRGYWLIVRPVKIEDRGDYSTISFGMFDGRRFFIEETKRKSSKRMETKKHCDKIAHRIKVDCRIDNITDKIGELTTLKNYLEQY